VILRAYRDGFLRIRPILERRRRIRDNRRMSDLEFYRLLRRFRISARELAFSDIDPVLREGFRPLGDTTSRSAVATVLTAGFAILLCLLAFAAISNGIGEPRLRNFTYVGAGLVYLLAVWRSRKTAWSRVWLIGVLSVGLACRAVLFLTPDSVEADYYRYLWDGALTAHGINPYVHVPEEVKQADVSDPRILALAEEGKLAVSRSTTRICARFTRRSPRSCSLSHTSWSHSTRLPGVSFCLRAISWHLASCRGFSGRRRCRRPGVSSTSGIRF
jgi:hypothetical protein